MTMNLQRPYNFPKLFFKLRIVAIISILGITSLGIIHQSMHANNVPHPEIWATIDSIRFGICLAIVILFLVALYITRKMVAAKYAPHVIEWAKQTYDITFSLEQAITLSKEVKVDREARKTITYLSEPITVKNIDEHNETSDAALFLSEQNGEMMLLNAEGKRVQPEPDNKMDEEYENISGFLDEALEKGKVFMFAVEDENGQYDTASFREADIVYPFWSSMDGIQAYKTAHNVNLEIHALPSDFFFGKVISNFSLKHRTIGINWNDKTHKSYTASYFLNEILGE